MERRRLNWKQITIKQLSHMRKKIPLTKLLEPNSPNLLKRRRELKTQQERRSLNNKRTRSTTLPEMMPRTTIWSKRHLNQSLQVFRRDFNLLILMKLRRPISQPFLPSTRMPQNRPTRSLQLVKTTLKESRKLPKQTRLMNKKEKLPSRLRKDKDWSKKTKAKLLKSKERLQLS